MKVVIIVLDVQSTKVFLLSDIRLILITMYKRCWLTDWLPFIKTWQNTRSTIYNTTNINVISSHSK